MFVGFYDYANTTSVLRYTYFSCLVYVTTLSVAQIIQNRMLARFIIHEVENVWKGAVAASSEQCSRIFVVALKKTSKYLSENIPCLGPCSNRTSFLYRSTVRESFLLRYALRQHILVVFLLLGSGRQFLFSTERE